MIDEKNGVIHTETVLIGLNAYAFTISDRRMIRYGRKTCEESEGLLVSSRFVPVKACLYAAHLLKDGKVKEARACYYMDDKDQVEYEKMPFLEQCLDALEEQFSQMTDHVYDLYYTDCRNRHDGTEETPEFRDFDLPYLMRIQDIFWYILDLRQGRYHGSGNIRYAGRRGIPRIETVGEKLYAQLLDLIWLMDQGKEEEFPYHTVL
ncbi:MAG: hypothetical protein IKD66_00015 [Solobacterium sp.]|nr:hypothetical protein [Solobacterium sp.]